MKLEYQKNKKGQTLQLVKAARTFIEDWQVQLNKWQYSYKAKVWSKEHIALRVEGKNGATVLTTIAPLALWNSPKGRLIIIKSIRHEAFILKEGFWYSDDEQHYPQPVPCKDPKWKVKRGAFLRKLSKVEDYVIAGNGRIVRYKGDSDCRICDEDNGSKEYYFTTESTPVKLYIWPEGLLHYVREHNVRPTKDFRDFIMGLNIS